MLFFLRRNYIWVISILVVLLLATGFFLYFRNGYNQSKEDRVRLDEAQDLYNKVGKHFFVPDNELPVVATITDPEKLQGQSFFAKAKKGDKVLIFTKAAEAILYDPIADKIVAIAPLNVDPNMKNSNGLENKKDNSLKF